MLFNFALPPFNLKEESLYVPFIAGIAIIGISDICGILQIPSQEGLLSYTGSPQSPTWNNYDPSKITMSGDTSGTHGGWYTTWFSPKKGYVWEDGTWDAKAIKWEIYDPLSLPIVGIARVGRAILRRSEV